MNPDSDGDGIMDNVDAHPWRKDMEWVAVLDNRYADVEYLRIGLLLKDLFLTDPNNPFTNGGTKGGGKTRLPAPMRRTLGTAIYRNFQGIRYLEVSKKIQRAADGQGIDWHEYWPELETVVH